MNPQATLLLWPRKTVAMITLTDDFTWNFFNAGDAGCSPVVDVI